MINMKENTISHIFDTHAFIKAFVNAKTDEEKGEVLARVIVAGEERTNSRVKERFEEAKDELATKSDIKELEVKITAIEKDIQGIRKDIKELDLKIAGLELKIASLSSDVKTLGLNLTIRLGGFMFALMLAFKIFDKFI